MFGFINIPKGEGPFPVIFMFHGHVDPKEYATLDYSVRYADALAEAGYIVLHPNLRGYAPSPPANNSLGIGDTVDALNLIALVRQQAGSDGLLKSADKERIGLWGHSMGGGIVCACWSLTRKSMPRWFMHPSMLMKLKILRILMRMGAGTISRMHLLKRWQNSPH